MSKEAGEDRVPVFTLLYRDELRCIVHDESIRAGDMVVWNAMSLFRNKSTGECWGSKQQIAEEAGVSEWTVTHACGRFKRAGYITLALKGRGNQNEIFFTGKGGAGEQPLEGKGGAIEQPLPKKVVRLAPKGGAKNGKGGANSQGTLYNKRQNNIKGFDREAGFKDAWQAYPRKEGSKEAHRHYVASVKSAEDHVRLMSAIHAYATSEAATKDGGKFCKHGSTFFNNWIDYIPPPSVQAAEQGKERERLAISAQAALRHHREPNTEKETPLTYERCLYFERQATENGRPLSEQQHREWVEAYREDGAQ